MTQRRLLALGLAILILQPRIAGAVARLLEFVEEAPTPRLSQPVTSVVSPDGAFVYVADFYYYNRAISIFSRDLGTGELSFTDVVMNGVGGVTNLAPRALALSPDGAHLYAAGHGTLLVFSRDGGTGALTWVETQQNGVGGVTSMSDAYDVVVSPDGAHVYVASFYTGSVVTFSRNGATGALTFVEAKVDGAPNGLNGAWTVAISADGAHVYVGGYNDGALLTFSRNAETGALTFVESDSISSPGRIALSADGAHAYVTSYPDRLSVYSRDAGTGALTFEQVHVDGVGGITAMYNPTDVIVTADGAHVYVTASGDNAVVVFSRNAGTGHLTFVEEKQHGVGGVIGLAAASSVVESPGGADLYLTAYGSYYYGGSALTGFARDAGTGALTQFEYRTSGVAPASMALSPDGAHLYGAGSTKVMTWARDGGTGSLTYAGEVEDGFDGVDGINGANEVVVSPDGAHVYVTSGYEYTVAVFSRNATTGALTFVEVERDGVGGVDDLADPEDLAISADGAYVYVAARSDNAVSVFARNAGTGELTETQVVKEGVGGVTGLYYPAAFALSPDGTHLYVAATYGGVSTFSRDAGTGALTQIATMDFGTEYPNDVGVSPDGAFVYVYVGGYYSDDAIRVFSRNPTTGALTHVSTIKKNEGGLSFPSYYSTNFVFTADGSAAYLLGAIFARNPASGSLAFVAAQSGPGYPSGVLALGPNGEAYTSANNTVQLYVQGFAGCEGGPLPVCRPAGAGIVRLGSVKPTLSWTWIGTSDVMTGDFGNPTYANHYALCMWDESGPTPTVIVRALAPAGQGCTTTGKACWKTSATGFTYRDPARTPEGLGNITLKAGTAATARVKVSGGKSHLLAPPFPVPLPIRMQLQSSTGECFEATFSTAGANTPTAFIARPD